MKILIVSHEAVGARMAGPGIRYWELAGALSGEFDVTLAVPATSDRRAASFALATYDLANPRSLEGLALAAEAILLSGYLLRDAPALGRTGCPIAVDLYDPFLIENLELRHHLPPAERAEATDDDRRVVNELLQVGDFFLCGSPAQRTFWLGMLAANGRLNPQTQQADPTFRSLTDLVPMGIPSFPLDRSGRHLKGTLPGLREEDFLVVWPGGVWDWLDPLTAIEAIHRLREQAPDVKLYFPGLTHPHPERVGAMAMPQRVRERAAELGLLNTRVLYAEWTPYAERSAYLAAADLAVSLHRFDLEAQLAVRARLLDCIWAEIPVVSTPGDAIAGAMAERGLATIVPGSDPEALAAAILGWRAVRDTRANHTAEFTALADEYRWSTVVRPLASFFRQRRKAADHAAPISLAVPATPAEPAVRPSSDHRWASEAALRLPFDQYQRHRQAAQAIGALRVSPDETLQLLDIGGGPAVSALFFGARDTVISLDLHPQPGRLSLAGDATRLPFADGVFDFSVSLDTLEHLPADRRPLLVEECLRVARRGAIIIAPTASSETVLAERILFEYIRVVLGGEHDQLREHAQNGLPELPRLESQLRSLGYPFLVRSSGYIHRWLAMMLLKHYLLALPGSHEVHQAIDRYYNLYYYHADQRSPGYRSFVFVAKSAGRDALHRVSQALESPDPPGERDPGQDVALAHLGLLVDVFTLGSLRSFRPSVDRPPRNEEVADLQVQRDRLTEDLARAEAQLSQRSAELAAAEELLARVGRGRVMRLLNGIRALASRSR